MTLWHRLMHAIGWNLCTSCDNGYRCVGCGKFTRWEERSHE